MSIKKIFAAALICAASVTAVFAQTWTKSTIQNVNGIDYELWNQNNTGNVSMEITGGSSNPNGGSFKAQWSGTENVLFRSGKKWGANSSTTYKSLNGIDLEFAATWSSGDNVKYLGVYGWAYFTQANTPSGFSNQIEYYIIQDRGSYNPCSNSEKGSATIDGILYGFHVCDRINQPMLTGNGTFKQFFSIPKNTSQHRTSGKISVSKHFEEWHKAGMYMDGPLYEVAMKVESYTGASKNSSGSANVTKALLTFGGGGGNSNEVSLTTGVTPTGGGTVTKSPNTDSYALNANVQVTATANTGYRFDGWSGDTTGMTNPLTVKMNKSKAITAKFVRMYTLTVSANPTAGGTAVKNPDSSSYASGTSVQVTATAKDGYKFDGWSGDASGTTNPLAVNMSRNKSITARFVSTGTTNYTLTTTASPTNGGEITRSSDPASGYASGAEVRLTAVPNDGWIFVEWADSLTGTESPATITMNANKIVTAKFEPVGGGDTTNLIVDGDFPGSSVIDTSQGNTSWTLGQGSNWGSGKSAATASVSGNSVTVNISDTGSAAYEPQLVQYNIPLDSGMTYRLTFTAKAAAAREIEASFQQAVDPWDGYASKTFNLTTSDKEYEMVFTMDAASDTSAQFALNMGQSTANVTISNVKLVSVAAEPSSVAGRRITQANVNKSSLRVTADKSAINVKFTGQDNGVATIKLYGLKGNLISTAKLQTAAGRSYSHTFNTGKLPRGFYVVGMYGNGKIEHTRVVVPR